MDSRLRTHGAPVIHITTIQTNPDTWMALAEDDDGFQASTKDFESIDQALESLFDKCQETIFCRDVQKNLDNR